MSQIMEKTLASLPKLLSQSLMGGSTMNTQIRSSPNAEVQNFMKYVHKARSKTQEARIVSGELTSMQQKLKQSDLTASPLLVRSSFTKAIFCYLLGYDVDFMAIHAVILAQQGKNFDKRLGYLVSCLLLHPHHEMVMLMMATLLRDLKSSNMGDNCVALTVIGHLVDSESIPSILPEVTKKFKHSHELVREKALYCFCSLYKRAPQLLEPTLPSLRSFLSSRDPGVLSAVVNIFVILCRENPSKFIGLGHSFLHILEQINSRGFGSSYYYHMVPLPWLQINLLKILSCLCPHDTGLSTRVAPMLSSLIERTKVSEPISLAILVESISTATKIPSNDTLLQLCSRCITKLLSSDASQEMRYQGLGLLISLAKVRPQYTALHQIAIVECLGNEDPTIQLRTTQLLHAMANRVNVKAICTKLFEQVMKTDKIFWFEIFQMIHDLAERLSCDVNWYIETCFSILRNDVSVHFSSKLRSQALCHVENVLKTSNPCKETLNNVVLVLLPALDNNTPSPLLALSVELLGIVAPYIEDFPVQEYLKAAEAIVYNPVHKSTFRNPVLGKGQTSQQLHLSEETKIKCLFIESTIKLLLSGSIDPTSLLTWLQGHKEDQASLTSVPVLNCLEELEDLVLSPHEIPARSKLLFHPDEVEIDFSLSFLDPLVVHQILNGGECYKPEYVKMAEKLRANLAASAIRSHASESSNEGLDASCVNISMGSSMLESMAFSSLTESKMSSSKTKNKWREEEMSESFSEPYLFVGVSDGKQEADLYKEETKKKELVKELFAGIDDSPAGLETMLSQEDKLQPASSQYLSQKQLGRHMWEDDDNVHEKQHGFSLNPFGMSPRKVKGHQSKTVWQDDVINDNSTSSVHSPVSVGSVYEPLEKSPSGNLYGLPQSHEFETLNGSESSLYTPSSLYTQQQPDTQFSPDAKPYFSETPEVMPALCSENNGGLDLHQSESEVRKQHASSVDLSISLSTMDTLTDSEPEDSDSHVSAPVP